MGQSDDIEDSTYSRHQDLCQKLNMDATAASEAWESYKDIRQKYSLEGDQLHWIGCALYVACRKSSTPTVGRTGTNVEGNCVSLTRLLRLCNLSLTQFFIKSKNWADMTHMPQDLRSKIDKLERNFVVSMVIFKKYQPIFTDIFKNPADDVAKPLRSRRQRAVPCTPSKVFEFCWTLFVCIKGAFPDISADLVNLNHLLLACCDLIYSNALLANRRDLLNPNFAGLPANYNDENYNPPETANCIINLLCEQREGISVDAKVIKEYYLKNHIKKLFKEKILRGDQSNFSGILEPLNFDGNSKAVNKAYEQHVLSVGDFDERKFLAEWRRVRLNGISNIEIPGRDITFHPKYPWHNRLKDADASDNIGSPMKNAGVGDFHEQYLLKREQYSGQMQHLAPPTPLTGRKYLRSKDMADNTPVSIANQSVSRLQALLARHKPKPSDALKEILNSCTQDIKASIEAKVHEIGEQFCQHYTQNTEGDACNVDFGRKRLQLAQTLFYKLLETILNDEKGKKPSFDITNLLSQEIFHQCLFACCLEIVLYAHNSQQKFPWILNALNLEAYYFYKVIEIIVRSEDQLSREIVKHLNLIEEQILETLAWKSDSPLWESIEKTPDGVPSYEEVSLPGALHLESIDPNTPGQPVLRRIALDRGNHLDVQQSPISSASERFQSPVAATGLAKKRLFSDGRLSGQQSVLRVGSGQSVLQSKLLTVEGDQKLLLTPNQITVLKTTGPTGASTPLQPISVNKEPAKPRRTGSVALFFRKFYYLAGIRMNDLCTKLELSSDIELKKKIWTIFEYSVKDQTHLMKDRHLDQILMCAVYVMCKIAKLDKNTFTEIMRCYRLQPQAASHIYRSVLIAKTGHTDTNSREPDLTESNVEDDNNTAAPLTPTCMAGTSQNYGSQVRGDLIRFYNTVYVPHVKEYANKFTSRGSMNLTLSPLPKSKPTAKSPVRRVTDSVMTRTLDPKAITATPAPHQLSYCFSRSPAKDLEDINKLMISLDPRKSVGKRLLTDDTDVDMTSVEHSPAKKTTTTFVARKLEHIIGDRRTQSQ